MTREELDKKLRLHADWSDGRAGGERADLKWADLKWAYLKWADLKWAYLEGAYLEGADLEGANLEGANLEGAYLEGANLKGAYLEGANLEWAHLDPIKHDFFAVLNAAPNEVPGLLAALKEGRIDGSCYSGDCACLVGTIANVRGCDYLQLAGLKPDSNRPAEVWFLGIGIDDTPESSPIVAITEGWINEWLAARPVSPAPVEA